MMKRRALWAAFVTAFSAEAFGRENRLPPSVDELTDHALAFEFHWNLFIRALAGCPSAGETSAVVCDRTRLIDYAEYFKARQAAKKLFGLREP